MTLSSLVALLTKCVVPYWCATDHNNQHDFPIQNISASEDEGLLMFIQFNRPNLMTIAEVCEIPVQYPEWFFAYTIQMTKWTPLSVEIYRCVAIVVTILCCIHRFRSQSIEYRHVEVVLYLKVWPITNFFQSRVHICWPMLRVSYGTFSWHFYNPSWTSVPGDIISALLFCVPEVFGRNSGT